MIVVAYFVGGLVGFGLGWFLGYVVRTGSPND